MSAAPLSVAVIGAGMAGRTHANAWRQAGTVYELGLPPVRLATIADAHLPFAEDAAAHFDRPPIGKSRPIPNDFYAHLLEPLDGIVRFDFGDRAMNMRMDAAPVHLRLCQFHALAYRDVRLGRAFCRGNEGLGRDAAVVEAFTAHPVAFDQRDFQPEQRNTARSSQTGSPASDHDNVM